MHSKSTRCQIVEYGGSSAEAIKPGSLAVTEYFEAGGKNVVTRMQPYPIQASEISDGPYVNWLDPQTAEIITIVNGKLSRQRIEKITEPRVIKSLKNSSKISGFAATRFPFSRKS